MNDKKKAQFQRVRELAEAAGVEIAAHFYQRAEVKAAADFVGGAGEVVARALASRAPAVMVCGASFMTGEIARHQPAARILIPRHDLSCPLAEGVGLPEVMAAKEEYPEALVVVDMKAAPEIRELADLVISPVTAREVLGQVPDRGLIVLPGAQVADWAGFGGQVVKRWPRGVCQVHELALAEDLDQARAEHPGAKVAVHLLCRPELRQQADFVGDSAAIRRYCSESPARQFIIVSEAGLAEYLAAANPEKEFFETEAEIFCPNMKLTTLKTMVACLEEYTEGPAK